MQIQRQLEEMMTFLFAHYDNDNDIDNEKEDTQMQMQHQLGEMMTFLFALESVPPRQHFYSTMGKGG